MEALVFWILAVGLVSGALAVLMNRNPVAAALSLVVTFIFLAGLFITLEAFFLAMVQIIVYAGAVMVLFLFIIMLLDIKAESRRPVPWGRVALVSILICGFVVVFQRVLGSLLQGGAVLTWGQNPIELTATELGRIVFSRYVLPFEATGVLLLVATLGVVLLSRRVDGGEK